MQRGCTDIGKEEDGEEDEGEEDDDEEALVGFLV
jgi:hypothetical protein